MKLPETTGGYAVKTYLFTLLAAVLCFFLNMSVTLVLSFSTTEKLGVRTNGALADGRTLVLEELHAKGDAPPHRKVFIVDDAGNETVLVDKDVATDEKLGARTIGTLSDGSKLVIEEYNATDVTSAYRKVVLVDADGNKTVPEDLPGDEVAVEDVLKQYAVTESSAEEIVGDVSTVILEQYPVTQSFSQNIRSETDPGLKNATNWVAQILMAILFLAFPYSNLWYLGDHDRNSVQFGHRAAEPLRGVKVGLLASIPAALAWVGLIVCKLAAIVPSYVVYYRWMNVCFWPYFNSVIPATVLNTADVTWGGVFAMLPILLILPLVTGLGYYLGYREVSVRDRLVYTTTGKKVKRRRR